MNEIVFIKTTHTHTRTHTQIAHISGTKTENIISFDERSKLVSSVLYPGYSHVKNMHESQGAHQKDIIKKKQFCTSAPEQDLVYAECV